MKTKATITFTSFEQALKSLKDAVASAPRSELERDGTIQRFEYTFELAWKAIRVLLFALGRSEVSGSPKPVLRSAFEEGLIDNIELWFEFLAARNASTHNYNNMKADEVFQAALKFTPIAENLLKNLKKKIKE